jgi:phage-related protein
MIDRTKKLPAKFYVTPTGRIPVRELLLGLPEEDRRTVGKDMQKVEFGWPIGMPLCGSLGKGLWEVRSDLSDGTIGRVIFCIATRLLHPIALVLNEFYRVAFRKKVHRLIDDLQADLDLWIAEYNEARPHQGRWCLGKTPMQTLLDAMPMTKEKMIAA